MENERCARCGNPSTSRCSKCKKVFYCSTRVSLLLFLLPHTIFFSLQQMPTLPLFFLLYCLFFILHFFWCFPSFLLFFAQNKIFLCLFQCQKKDWELCHNVICRELRKSNSALSLTRQVSVEAVGPMKYIFSPRLMQTLHSTQVPSTFGIGSQFTLL